MRALQLSELSGPDALELVEMADPQATEGMALIEVHAAGVGFVDLLVTRGEYQIKPPLPFVPGIEVAGRILAAGPQSGLAVGQRVAASTPFGAFAELALAPEPVVFAIPDEMSFEAAAGYVVNYQTAHLGLLRRGRLAAGEVVLVHGAAGGVGTASIQVARAAGARVIAVARGERKREVAREAGANEVLDVDEDWVAEVRALTDGRGADVVVDPVGGDRFDQSLRCMAPEGRLLVIGFAEGRIPQLPVNRLLLRHLDVIGVNYGGFLSHDVQFARRAGEQLYEWARTGAIAPVVGPRYPLEQGAQALHDLAERRAVGKPVLIVR
jgi:NADPH:quinone reductase